MELIVNGQPRQVEQPLTCAQLLAELGIALSTTVAEVNGEIVPRGELAGLVLCDGDSVELVTIVGGG